MPASEKDFEKVRSTMTLSCSVHQRQSAGVGEIDVGFVDHQQPATRCASVSMASIGTSVPDGELGLTDEGDPPARLGQPRREARSRAG